MSERSIVIHSSLKYPYNVLKRTCARSRQTLQSRENNDTSVLICRYSEVDMSHASLTIRCTKWFVPIDTEIRKATIHIDMSNVKIARRSPTSFVDLKKKKNLVPLARQREQFLCSFRFILLGTTTINPEITSGLL